MKKQASCFKIGVDCWMMPSPPCQPNDPNAIYVLLRYLSESFREWHSQYERLQSENESLRKLLTPNGQRCSEDADLAKSQWRSRNVEEDAVRYLGSSDTPSMALRDVTEGSVVLRSLASGDRSSSKLTLGAALPIEKMWFGHSGLGNTTPTLPGDAVDKALGVTGNQAVPPGEFSEPRGAYEQAALRQQQEREELKLPDQYSSMVSSSAVSEKPSRRQASRYQDSRSVTSRSQESDFVASSNSRVEGDILSHWTKGVSSELDFDSFQDLTVGQSRTALTRSRRSGDVATDDGSVLQRLVLRPGCKSHILWDVASITVMLFDCLLTPMSVFGFHHIDMLPNIVLAQALFWSLDVLQNFFVGFVDGGMIELRPGRICMRYLRSWFVPDVVLCSMDWVFAVSDLRPSSHHGLFRLTKTARLLRLMRMVRLLRLVKLADIFVQLDALVSSRLLGVIVRVVRNVICIVMVNHFIACAFYALSEWQREEGTNSWIQHLRSDKYDDPPTLLYKYTTALHWALTQFTPASMEVFPCNALERIFAVCVMVFSVVVFSAMVGSISAAMTQLSDIKAEYVKQSELVRRYITEHRVSVDLGNRVFTFVRSDRKQREARPILEAQVPVLRTLPDNLRFELHTEVYSNTLTSHLFLRRLATIDHITVVSLCHNAMVDLLNARGETILEFGHRAINMLFYKRGELSYLRGGSMNPAFCSTMSQSCAERLRHVEPGRSLSECALWVWWRYKGDLVAQSVDAEFFALHAPKFAKIVRQGPGFNFSVAYAKQFAQHAAQVGTVHPSRLDLCGTIADIMPMVIRACYDINLVPSRTGSFVSTMSPTWGSLSNRFCTRLHSMLTGLIR